MNSLRFQTVIVLGAGTMGTQISYTCATHDYSVRLLDRSPAALDAARDKHREWAEKEIPDAAGREAALAQISFQASIESAVAGTDLVIESLPEDLELKRKVFAQLDQLCPPTVVLASNSSSLRMSRIETGVKHRDRVCNLHFFHRHMPAIEIMRGSATSPAVIERVRQFAVSLGLLPFVLRGESTGFLYGRIWRAIKREVLHEVAEGVATPEDIDRIVMLQWRWEKGPFAWMDAVGLDVVRDIEQVYFEESGDPKDKPPAFLDLMIARGELGVKTGKGFYDWTPDPAELVRSRAAEDLTRQSQRDAVSAANRGRFIGAWRLVSFEAGGDGETAFPFGQDAIGLLIYAAAGQMSVILSKSARPAFGAMDPAAGAAEEKAGAFESCFAYSGRFEVTEGRVIHRLQQCTFPNWVGTEQVRFFRFEGDRLILETPPLPTGGRNAVSRLTWERINP